MRERARNSQALREGQSGNTTGRPNDLAGFGGLRLGADEIDQIVRGGDVGVVEEGNRVLD
jgi:hypothetical protein